MPTTLQVHWAKHRASGFTECYKEVTRMPFHVEEYLPRQHLCLLREQMSIKAHTRQTSCVRLIIIHSSSSIETSTWALIRIMWLSPWCKGYKSVTVVNWCTCNLDQVVWLWNNTLITWSCYVKGLNLLQRCFDSCFSKCLDHFIWKGTLIALFNFDPSNKCFNWQCWSVTYPNVIMLLLVRNTDIWCGLD